MRINKSIRQYLLRIALNMLVLGLFGAYLIQASPHSFHERLKHYMSFMDRLENYLYDARVRMDMRPEQDPRIVIVDIDEKSLQAEGHWPWRRDKLALLLDNLFDKYHAKVVGFDVVFAEPDNSSGLPVLRKLAEDELKDSAEYRERIEQISKQLDYDELFAESIARHPVILGAYFNLPDPNHQNQEIGTLPPPVFSEKDLHGVLAITPPCY